METGRQAVRESRHDIERRVEESKEAFQAGFDAARAEHEAGHEQVGEEEPDSAETREGERAGE